jgi:hypothetical protein
MEVVMPLATAPTVHIALVEMPNIAVPTAALVAPAAAPFAAPVAVGAGRHWQDSDQNGEGKYPANRLGHLHFHLRFLKVWKSTWAASLEFGVKITARGHRIISLTADVPMSLNELAAHALTKYV